MGRARSYLFGSLTAVVLFAAVARAVAEADGILAALDRALPLAVTAWRSPPLTAAMVAVTSIGGWIGIAVVSVAAAVTLARRGRWRAVALLTLCVGGAAVLTLALKQWFDRPRPHVTAMPELPALVQATGASFPSGHALQSLVLYGLLLVLFAPTGMSRQQAASPPAGARSRRPAAGLTIATAGMLALIGVSRVYLGVHYPSDVIGGWLAGLAWLGCCLALLQRYEGRMVI